MPLVLFLLTLMGDEIHSFAKASATDMLHVLGVVTTLPFRLPEHYAAHMGTCTRAVSTDVSFPSFALLLERSSKPCSAVSSLPSLQLAPFQEETQKLLFPSVEWH